LSNAGENVVCGFQDVAVTSLLAWSVLLPLPPSAMLSSGLPSTFASAGLSSSLTCLLSWHSENLCLSYPCPLRNRSLRKSLPPVSNRTSTLSCIHRKDLTFLCYSSGIFGADGLAIWRRSRVFALSSRDSSTSAAPNDPRLPSQKTCATTCPSDLSARCRREKKHPASCRDHLDAIADVT